MKKVLLIAGLICIYFSSCSNDGNELSESKNQNGKELARAVNISTRAGLGTGTVGLYMVYDEMIGTGNYIDNLSLTSNSQGDWSPESTIYWKDNNSAASFIGYAPYSGSVSNALSYGFSVLQDQSTADAVNASDFVWGKLSAQEPTDRMLNLTLNHIMSRVVVIVAPGEGFTQDELKNGTLSVKLDGMKTNANINLSDGTIQATGSVSTIKPCKENDLHYTAIVVPQTVNSTGIVTVTWNGGDYILTRGITFEPGKSYSLTVNLKKTQGGINVGIGDWEDAGEDYGGTVY